METYVVRVWVPASAGDAGADQDVAPELRGEVEHPRSGLRHRFTTLDDLAAVLRGEPTGLTLTDLRRRQRGGKEDLRP